MCFNSYIYHDVAYDGEKRLPTLGSLIRIADYQLYHMFMWFVLITSRYAYIASERHTLFIINAITISDSFLSDVVLFVYFNI